MLEIYNSLTRKKETFRPIESGKVRMYVCGMTVYDYCHLGHARVMVVFDVVARYLRHLGYDVTYVRNITDIDDKIINRAREGGEEMDALTGRFIEAMYQDADALGVLRPDYEPRATRHLDEIVEMIHRLIETGHAYVAGNGDVYYDVSRFAGYGRLSGKHVDELRSGARVEVEEAKDDPLDFVLWKAAKPGEPQWDSPWGRGRPGWHIECSAMSTACLGEHFDIHGGGMDLQFPHHENEIAQSEAATGHKFVNVWMHNGFVRVDNEKMSKSLGNFFTVREILKRYKAEVVRYFIVNSHYRSPLNYADTQLESARAALDAFYTSLRGLPQADENESGEPYRTRFQAAMDDDFNTAEAIALLAALRHDINKAKEAGETERAAALAATLRRLGAVLGLFRQGPEAYLRSASPGGKKDLKAGLTETEIEMLVQKRTEARRARNWEEADRIRDHLLEQGVALEDGSLGTIWRRL